MNADAGPATTYDAAGNLTFDGIQSYTYDAWNRLTKVAHAYSDGTTTYSGQTGVTMKYDGLGRRIVKTIANTGRWDGTLKYYYDGQRAIEIRNGSDQLVRQMVWGRNYIDELIQVNRNGTKYWACQDANFNVLGLVGSTGVLSERYEYTPYGQRTVFIASTPNATGSSAGCWWPVPATMNPGSYDAGPWGLCEFGHQGLAHDEEIGLVYNRSRFVQPSLSVFLSRDPTGYADGPSLYSYQRRLPVSSVDPMGLETWRVEPCNITLVYNLSIQFEDRPTSRLDHTQSGNDAWSDWRKERFKNRLKSQVENAFKGTIKSMGHGRSKTRMAVAHNPDLSAVYPGNLEYDERDCCICKTWSANVEINFTNDESDGNAKVQANIHDEPIRSQVSGTDADLDEGDVNLTFNGIDWQYGGVHEFGHLIGLNHPGWSITPRPPPNSQGDYTADPTALMGGGMQMRPSYFRSFEKVLDAKYPECSLHMAQ